MTAAAALVTQIQRFSVHDGPGIRTTVFLKGCPLSCKWCHNPECISFEREELFYPEKCIGCGKCKDGCFSDARVWCGSEMTPEEVFKEVLADKAYYGSDGGVTVSGGEPLAHADFTKELLTLCRDNGIGTAIETSMYRFDPEILSLCDHIMTDIKTMDNALHIEMTGIPNTGILENIAKASRLGIPMTVRTPLVVGVNADARNIRKTAEFLKNLPHSENIIRYELLPYHPLGVSKARALGKEQMEFKAPDKALMEELSRYADIRGSFKISAANEN